MNRTELEPGHKHCNTSYFLKLEVRPWDNLNSGCQDGSLKGAGGSNEAKCVLKYVFEILISWNLTNCLINTVLFECFTQAALSVTNVTAGLLWVNWGEIYECGV